MINVDGIKATFDWHNTQPLTDITIMLSDKFSSFKQCVERYVDLTEHKASCLNSNIQSVTKHVTTPLPDVHKHEFDECDAVTKLQTVRLVAKQMGLTQYAANSQGGGVLVNFGVFASIVFEISHSVLANVGTLHDIASVIIFTFVSIHLRTRSPHICTDAFSKVLHHLRVGNFDLFCYIGCDEGGEAEAAAEATSTMTRDQTHACVHLGVVY